MKKLFTIITFLSILFYQLSFSQTIQEDITKRVNESTHIFEGRVIRSDSYWNRNVNYIYTSSTIEIYKVFKGAADLQCGTVEIITEGGTVGDVTLDISHNLVLRRGMTGIFLCNQTQMELPVVDYYNETNPIKLDVPYGLDGFIRYFQDGINYSVVDWQFSLDSLAQAYNLIQLYTTLTLVDCGISPVIPNPVQNLPEILAPVYPNQYIPSLPQSATIQSSTTREIEFNYLNRHVLNSIPVKYFEFDIAINDDSDSIYFQSADIDVRYPAVIFGKNVVADSNVIVTFAGNFINTNAYTINPVDNPNDTAMLIIQIRPDQNSTDALVDLQDFASTIPAIHVRIGIVNCNMSGAISMAVPSPYVAPAWSATSHYSAATPTPYFPWWSTTITFPSCDIHIDNLLSSNNPLRGGTGDTVTILGMNFDTARGNGNVWLRNANDNVSYLPLDSSDYLSWNDSVIKFIMPGNIENSVYFNDNQYGVPGSGIFKVQNNAADTAWGDSITVLYSIRQSWYPFGYDRKEIFNLVKGDLSPTDGIQFRYDTAFSKTLHPDRYKTLDLAIKQWVCLHNVNFSLGDSLIPAHDSIYADGIDMIQFGGVRNNALAHTEQWVRRNCGHYSVPEIDLIINKNIKDSLAYNIVCGDSIPVNKYDAYEILLHELGHAHSLNHVNKYNSIMYWASRPSDVNPIMGGDRKVFIKEDASANGGSGYVMTKSIDTSFTNCGTVHPMSPLYLLQCDTLPMRISSAGSYLISSCFPLVSEINKAFSNLIVFPNPTLDIITVNFTSYILQKNYIKIYDIWGNELIKQKYETFYGSNSIQLDVKNLQSGIYCIGIDCDEGRLFYKFIKE